MRDGVRWLAGLACLCAACLPITGGVNRGGRAPGSGTGGVALAGANRREIAVDPGGKFALYGKNSLTLADLKARTAEPLPGLPPPTVLAFWTSGEGFFGLAPFGGEKSPEQNLYSFDLATRSMRWDQLVLRADRALRPLAGGKHLFVWGSAGNARFVDAETGQSESLIPLEGAIVDVDELPSGSLLLTESLADRRVEQGPRTVLRVVASDGKVSCRVEVENCADEVLVAQGGGRAFLAPTFCGKDPVSVVDLKACKLETTLPGFGPVALARQGRTVVAFADREAGGPLPVAIQSSPKRYHLLLIDAASLGMEAIPLEDWLPRYVAPPTGRWLLLDTSKKPPVQPRLIDLEKRESRLVFGPAIPLESFVMTPDERHLFVMANGLYDLRVDRRQMDSLPLPFVPEAINRTPDGEAILLLEEDRLHLLQPDPMRFIDLLSP